MATTSKKELLKWYADLRPLKVDVVGDFAGRELYVVHGESLLRYCLEQSRVDFEGGFQLLHAVYAVEKFLSDMHKRGCNFDIIFFNDVQQLCIAHGSLSSENAYKYILARKIIIRHLSRSASEVSDGVRSQILEFDSLEDNRLHVYLKKHAVHFFLCHEGDESKGPDTVALRSIIHWVISRGINVAILNHVQFQSSKMFVPLFSGGYRGSPMDALTEDYVRGFPTLAEPSIRAADLDAAKDVSAHSGGTLRETYSVVICRIIQRSEQLQRAHIDEMIRAFLLHTSLLELCLLWERRLPAVHHPPMSENQKQGHVFIRCFSEAASLLLSMNPFARQAASSNGAEDPTWDLYDLLDGRLFFSVLHGLRNGQTFPEKAVERASELASSVARSNSKTLNLKNVPIAKPGSVSVAQKATAKTPSVLPFSHPVVDKYLGGMTLREEEEVPDSAADVIFKDLTHWHNSRNSLASKTLPWKRGFFARKRHQKLMADVEAYSRSLTNVGGGNLARETIVASTPLEKEKKKAKDSSSRRAASNENSEHTQVKPRQKAQDKKKVKPSGKEAAYLAAEKLQMTRADKLREDAARHWGSTVASLENDHALSPLDRYLKAEAIVLRRSSKDDRLALGGEVELYLCHVLGIIWRNRISHPDAAHQQRKGMYILSSIWNWLVSSGHSPVNPAVQLAIGRLSSILGTPPLSLTVRPQVQRRELPFDFNYDSFKGASELFRDHRALQLEYGGPYMDRRFDSRPDSRVNFEPDAWQRDVLDSIDAEDCSLLVVAPTSAGKTFISFYAMKKVLQESDDSVLVYVAPTKALVNQIAAEINAHYSKSYLGRAGKSVYGIHTRDYRVNNPTGCQILVTVPHILQILLLSSSHAMGPNAWSKRIRRIIFDEVHCIGQSEDGVIWEQLLLMAPCPIIALSATVGNQAEFRDWLAMAQAKKGYRLNMVVHDVRYSELRKFIYTDSTGRVIEEGMERQQTIPVPGLDEGDYGESGKGGDGIQFLHPVMALSEGNKDALGDISFEARDLFTLWKLMRDLLTDNEMKELDVPEPCSPLLPPIIAKSDVINWERKMKEALRKLMDRKASVFEKIRSHLDPQPRESPVPVPKLQSMPSQHRQHKQHVYTLPNLAHDLNRRHALPALVFNYDRKECEDCAEVILAQLTQAEEKWKANSPEWKRKLRAYNDWKQAQMKISASLKKDTPAKGMVGEGNKERVSKLDILRETGVDHSPWERFNPKTPLDPYSFADHSKIQVSELEETIQMLVEEEHLELRPWMELCLRRGVGVHHSGLNRRYRQTVEMLFRRGFLRLVIATGTLAMGVNMPCKTVIFSGDSVFLTAQTYRQSSGRAGRRGFDLLGNVVFNGFSRQRVHDLVASRLPALRGQFPISTTLILRLLGLLHETKNSDFAARAADALLSQTRLYLGGPESEGSVRHHLRFSIEYLRRQHLLSAKGEPINFAGMVGHLYFTENAVFAFHSLLKGGYFHRLCSGITKDLDGTRREMVLVLSHLFCRVPVKRTEELVQDVHRSASVVFLPRLPSEAEVLLTAHNRETLSIFKGYVHSYIDHSLADKPDHTLPFTQTTVGGEGMSPVWLRDQGDEDEEDDDDEEEEEEENPSGGSVIRSPFVSLSGFDDNFTSIHDLCSTVRDGVFLEESAIPYIPIWPVDAAATELNAYIYDFYKHGSMDVLTRDNRIKGGDVWFHLKDFSLTLSTIVTGLEAVINGEQQQQQQQQQSGDEYDMHDIAENAAEAKSLAATADVGPEEDGSPGAASKEATEQGRDHGSQDKGKKLTSELKDSWDDSQSDRNGSDSDEGDASTSGATAAKNSSGSGKSTRDQQQEGSLLMVLEAMISLRDDFNEKFRKVWA